MPIYTYKNPKTGEQFDIIRPVKDRDKDYVLEDGTACERVINWDCSVAGSKMREGFEMDPDFYKKAKPKRVKFRDGHREKYDPTRHC